MNRAVFFEAVRVRAFGGALTQSQVNGLNVLLDAFEAARWPLGWAAYALATTKHETAHTMQPIAEYGHGAGRKYGVRDPRTGQVYYGRGYVQLTWLANYAKAGDKLGVDLVHNPDLALQPAIAARILIAGMAEGWFTGKKLGDYIGPARSDYAGARRIINGMDRAEAIAGMARAFEAALKAAGYGRAAQAAPEAARPAPAAAPALRQPDDPGPRVAPPARPGFWSRFWSALVRRGS